MLDKFILLNGIFCFIEKNYSCNFWLVGVKVIWHVKTCTI